MTVKWDKFSNDTPEVFILVAASAEHATTTRRLPKIKFSSSGTVIMPTLSVSFNTNATIILSSIGESLRRDKPAQKSMYETVSSSFLSKARNNFIPSSVPSFLSFLSPTTNSVKYSSHVAADKTPSEETCPRSSMRSSAGTPVSPNRYFALCNSSTTGLGGMVVRTSPFSISRSASYKALSVSMDKLLAEK